VNPTGNDNRTSTTAHTLIAVPSKTEARFPGRPWGVTFMNRRAWAVVLAVVLAVLGTFTVFMYVRNADARALAGQEVTDVYVAVKEVPVGTTAQTAVDDGLMVKQEIAAKGVPDDALTTVDSSNAELVATSNIQSGEIVLTQRFATTAAAPGVLALPDGMMAVSVALADPAHVGSFLEAGAEVTVFDSFNVAENKPGTTPAGDHLTDNHDYTRATRVLLPRVSVLAVGATTTTGSTDSSSSSQTGTPANQAVTLVTVAVTQDQAEKLIHGAQTGTLYLGLLNSQSTVDWGNGIDDRNLFVPKD
jgi:pilus assembly protein CpaB